MKTVLLSLMFIPMAATAAGPQSLVLKDARGEIVATEDPYNEGNFVMRINGILMTPGAGFADYGFYENVPPWVAQLGFQPPPAVAGFVSGDASSLTFFHTTTNCSGERYFTANPKHDSYVLSPNSAHPLIVFFVLGKTGFYAYPGAWVFIQSVETFEPGQDYMLPGNCTSFQGTYYFVGPPLKFDITSLGFTPPFRFVLQ